MTTTTTTAPATPKKAPAKKATTRPQAAKKALAKAASPTRTPAGDEVAQDLSRRLLAARAAGIIRPRLSELIGLKQSAIWRCEQGRAYLSEIKPVVAVLDKIDAGEIQPPERARGGASRSDLQHRVDAASAALAASGDAKTVPALRKIIQLARDVLEA